MSVKFYFAVCLICLFSIAGVAQQSMSHNVFFETNSSTLSSREQAELTVFMKGIDTVKVTAVSVLGYCDDKADADYNKVLSNTRAQRVNDILIKFGIEKKLLKTAEGKGEVALAEGNTKSIEEQRTFNRRVQITLQYTRKEKSILSDNQQVGDKVQLQNILFVGGRSIFLQESYTSLDKLYRTLAEKPQYYIVVIGHICCPPPGEEKLDGVDLETQKRNLSEARAAAVYTYLVDKGLDEGRLSYRGDGARFPLGKGAKFDRRVEVEITKVVMK